ncbi:substrate-binding domain-containing protein [uncultured Chloroflexus sp.]|uniref:substrate-binding domain-containing protein n=3 Tax=uncultured Chloroflexus sp. TaxID=214040 RepID=UPI0026339958|nr:substrate-binding domain-containing protein [uncultured Chloroflexus sp.]
MLIISRTIAGIYVLATLILVIVTVIFGPIGWSPLPLPTAAPPIRVELAVSSEKEAWLRSALERFARTNPTISGRAVEVRMRVTGSIDLITAIERDGYQPTVVSPASELQLAELRQWRDDLLREPAQALAFTPLVALMREAPATKEIANPWQLWQRQFPDQINNVKIGISSPIKSNGGLQSLIVLAAQYHDEQTSLTVDQASDPGLEEWLRQLNSRIVGWPESTGTLTAEFVTQTGLYDIITTYENLALQTFPRGEAQGLGARIYYPTTTIVSDHPYAILTAPWVGNAERAAARLLRDFLLSAAEQTIAMREYGFRPAHPQVTIDLNDSTSLFGRYRDYGLQLDLASQLAIPSPDVVNKLVDTWSRATKKPERSHSCLCDRSNCSRCSY